MTTPNEMQALRAVGEAIKQSCEQARKDGIAEGYSVAERIAMWWVSNHTLAKPHSQETLEAWTRDALQELKMKLK